MLNNMFRMLIKRKKLTTVKDVFAAMAKRQNQVADMLGVDTSMVSKMIADEYIPPGHHMRIEEYLHRHGYAVDRERVFRFRPIRSRDAPDDDEGEKVLETAA